LLSARTSVLRTAQITSLNPCPTESHAPATAFTRSRNLVPTLERARRALRRARHPADRLTMAAARAVSGLVSAVQLRVKVDQATSTEDEPTPSERLS
jgi:hypothetical protein